jgi:hypothetical protein
MSSETREKEISHHMNRCKHYSGIFGPMARRNITCKVGIRYDDVRVEMTDRAPNMPKWEYPCWNPALGPCPRAEYPTRQEAEQWWDDTDREIKEYFAKIGEHICPQCGNPMTKRQIGRCVYAHPCGHRLYQGSI